jgi:hypothetical protein
MPTPSPTCSSAAPRGAGDGWSELPSVSGDGRYVAFQSTSTNLVDGDTDNRSDIFVRDRFTGPEARYAVSDLETDDTVRSGSRVRIEARVMNVGELTGWYDAVLRLDGTVVHRESVRVRDDRTERLEFELRVTKPGVHTIRLGPLTRTFTVR